MMFVLEGEFGDVIKLRSAFIEFINIFLNGFTDHLGIIAYMLVDAGFKSIIAVKFFVNVCRLNNTIRVQEDLITRLKNGFLFLVNYAFHTCQHKAWRTTKIFKLLTFSS